MPSDAALDHTVAHPEGSVFNAAPSIIIVGMGLGEEDISALIRLKRTPPARA